MRTPYVIGCIASFAALTCLAADHTVTISVTGPAAVGFFPPVTQEELDNDDGGIREGTAHVGFALEDLEKCLAPRKLDVRFEFARSLTIVDGSNTRRFDFPPDWEHQVGIVLVAPGREPEVIYATAGPSSLGETAPQVAWKYFGEPNCKRY